MKKWQQFLLIVLTLVLTIHACTKESDHPFTRELVLEDTLYNYAFVPAEVSFDPFGGFEIDNLKARLGRVLFYETQLSINNRVSCGSCHKQALAFSDNINFSLGFDGRRAGRNTSSIVNTSLQSAFFWDMRETSLRNMVVRPIANHIEMGLENPDYMSAKIGALSYYAPLFEDAFGSAEITKDKIAEALEQFVRSLISVDSKFDEGQRTGFINFSDQEIEGKNIYFSKLPCSGCHGGNILAGDVTFAENIGLNVHYTDKGLVGNDPLTGDELNGLFKVPSLRNIELTGPYMHDGRFNTLEEVVEFYNSGIQHHQQLSFMLRKNTNGGFFFMGDDPADTYENQLTGVQPLRMHLSTVEKQALVAFMKTFTDRTLTIDPKFSDPFILVAK